MTYLEVALKVTPAHRAAAAAVHEKSRQPYLDSDLFTRAVAAALAPPPEAAPGVRVHDSH
ncbi:hypothetical protein EDD39_7515 [Kitasatospora cineracea]|uniref:Uncharacterized protein n=1 Tax=Kitasatospora cineracea TaxID=88074 RepID=A0A8G1XBX7_9ACTN|nr:hypothetical protein EDD39_7515 [Kitasatospora cineracea]